jgi:hypothetical protein
MVVTLKLVKSPFPKGWGAGLLHQRGDKRKTIMGRIYDF